MLRPGVLARRALLETLASAAHVQEGPVTDMDRRPLADRYHGRPDVVAEIRANWEAWERLREMASESSAQLPGANQCKAADADVTGTIRSTTKGAGHG